MKVPKFKEYLTEKVEIDNSNVKVVVITKQFNQRRAKIKPELTVDHIQTSCKELGIPCFVIQTKYSYISDKDVSQKTFKVYNYDGKKSDQEFFGPDTVVFARRGSIDSQTGLSLLSSFEDAGAFMVNTKTATLDADNKLTSTMMFEKSGIPTPRTAYCANEYSIPKAHKQIGGKFPVIIKTMTGTQGIGVTKAPDYDTMVSTIQALWKFDAELLIQEYVDIDFDVRTIVMGDRIIASTKREKVSGEFRSNMHRTDKKGKPYILSKEETDIIIKTARACATELVGVDHVIVNGKPMVLEVNGSPGSGADYEGYMYQNYSSKNDGKINGEEMVRRYVKYFTNKENWDVVSLRECGYLETIDIKGIGPLRAKFDTGNGTRATMLNVDTLEIKKNQAMWSYRGKKFTNNIVGYSHPVHVGEKGERPIVLIEVSFAGEIYKDVPFGLELKDSKSTVLVNRELLTRFRVSVSPNRKFVLSDYRDKEDETDNIKTDPIKT